MGKTEIIGNIAAAHRQHQSFWRSQATIHFLAITVVASPCRFDRVRIHRAWICTLGLGPPEANSRWRREFKL
jgi:hypothetical protein